MTRLKKLAWGSLDNVQYENEKIYEKISENLSEIETFIDNIENSKDDDFIGDELIKIERTSQEIEIYVNDAKNNGIINEGYLHQGKDIITDLETEIYNLESQLELLEIQYDDLYSSTTANKRLGKKHVYICDVHDEMHTTSEELTRVVNEMLDSISNDKLNDKLKSNYIEKFNDCVYSIKNNIDECIGMNESMGLGIDAKNDSIENLQSEINDLELQITDKENEISDLRYELNN